ncbi:MAG: hypothetical protein V3T86_11115 [Planctomycetota bacterium]
MSGAVASGRITLLGRVAVFVAAVTLGGLAARAQDGGGVESLSAEIDRLNGLLRVRAQARGAAAAAQKALRLEVYEVGDLCAPVPVGVWHPTNLVPSQYDPEKPEEQEAMRLFEIDQLVELITQTVEPPTWDELAGASVEPARSRLIVRTLPRVHAGVARLLAWCREVRNRRWSAVVLAVEVSTEEAEALRAVSGALDDDTAKRLLARKVLGQARLTGLDGQCAVEEEGSRRTYLRDYDVEIAKDAKIGDPRRATIFDGLAVSVTGCLGGGGGDDGAILHCRFQRTKVEDPIARHDTEHGEIDTPRLQLTRLNTSFWAPFGKAMLVGGATVAERPCVFVVIARRVGVAR